MQSELRKNLELDTVFLLELVHTTAGIDKLLFAGEERMAVGANLNAEVLSNRAALESVAACASYRCFVIVGMDPLFHSHSPLSALDLFVDPEL